MPDAIKRPEPTAYRHTLEHAGESTTAYSRAPLLRPAWGDAQIVTRESLPLYTRADVIAWARAVIEDTLVACECGQSGCYVCAGDSAVCQALNTLDDAAREWEAENA